MRVADHEATPTRHRDGCRRRPTGRARSRLAEARSTRPGATAGPRTSRNLDRAADPSTCSFRGLREHPPTNASEVTESVLSRTCQGLDDALVLRFRRANDAAVALSARTSRDDRKGSAGKRGDRAKGSLVKCQDAIRAIAVGEHYQRGIGEPDPQIAVTLHQRTRLRDLIA